MQRLRSAAGSRSGLYRSPSMLTAGAVCVAVVAIAAAPIELERTRILVVGSDDAPAIAAVAAAAQRQAYPAIAITTQADGITIERRGGANASAPSGLSNLLAKRAVAAVIEAAIAVMPPPLPATALRPAIGGLNARRGTAQSAHDQADLRITDLSAALTGIARDIAAAQRLAAVPAIDPAAALARAMLATIQLRRLDLASRYTADFPAIAIADEEIARLQALLAHAARRPQPTPSLEIATLRAEQVRVQTALDSETRRRDQLAGQLTGIDGALAAQLAFAVPASVQMPALVRYTIVELPLTTLPDPRQVACSLIAVVSLAASWLARRRRRPPENRLQVQIAAIERQLHLPVLRYLDSQGAPLQTGHRGALPPNGQIWP